MKKNKVWRITARLLTLALLGTMFPAQTVTALAAETEQGYEIINISTAEELTELAGKCSLDVWSLDKKIVLQDDISLKESEYVPIPTFGGIFDGNGHTISGLELTESVTPAGLISTLQEQGVVKNLKVSGTVAPEGEGICAGGIAGENNGIITGCSFSGNVIGKGNVGGIAGVNALTGQIGDCTGNGTIIGEKMTGGIAGCNLGSISRCKNYAYINTVSVDPSVSLEDIRFDFVFDVSRLTSVDTGRAASDTGGIAGYSSGMLEECVNSAPVGYPHIGYNAGGIAGRSCGYLGKCENTSDIYGRKDVGGIVGQMEPYIRQNITESALQTLERQLDELNVLLNRTLDTADASVGTVTARLNHVADYLEDAAKAAQNIHTYGSVASTVTGSGSAEGSGSIGTKPSEEEENGEEERPSVSGNGLSGGDRELGGLLPDGVEGEHSGAVNGNISASTQISITTQLNGLSAAVLGMSDQMKLLNGETAGISGDLKEDLKAVQNQIHAISDTAMSLFSIDDEDVLIDSSETNVEQITQGKVLSCENSGKVNGDINVGGIAGSMAMEYELDPEDDLSFGMDGKQRRKLELRAVAEGCVNQGEVTAKRSCAGGICGRMELGLITLGENYGNVTSESGDYVGGIAGLTASTVRQCFAKCTLSGDKYVGGIVGSGVAEDLNGGTSTVAGCRSMVAIEECEEYGGAVSGVDAGTFAENLFVSDDLAGINRRSYVGRAEPVAYEDLVNGEAGGGSTAADTAADPDSASDALETAGDSSAVPDAFHHLTLTFMADGKELKTLPFAYGESFGGEVFPDLPEKEGYYAEWDRTDLKNLHFDTIVTAVYTPYVSALANEEKRPDGRSIFLVEGQFDEDALLAAVQTQGTPEAFDEIPDNGADFLVKSFSGTSVCREITEQWQLTIPEDGAEVHTVRYLPPEETSGNLKVYVKEGQNWKEASVEIIGSYLTFEATGNEAEIAVLSVMEVWWVWLCTALLLLLLIAATARLLYKRAKRKKRERLLAGDAAESAKGEVEPDAGKASEPDNPKKAPSTEEAETPSGDASKVQKQAETGQKKKRKGLLPAVGILLLAGVVFAAYMVFAKVSAAAQAYELLKDYAEQEEISMDLTVSGKIAEERFDFSAYAECGDTDGHRITVISQEDRKLYYTDDAVFLENGKAYQLSPSFPDYSELTRLALELYQHTELEERDGAYLVTAGEEATEAILEILMPSAADMLPKTNVITVELYAENGRASEICFVGRGVLQDDEKSPFDISASLKLYDGKQKKIEIPQAVKEAVLTGQYESTEVLSDALLQLSEAWKALQEPETLGAKIVLEADCGPIVLNESFDFYHWKNGGMPISSLQKNGYAVYFTEEAVCDGSGRILLDTEPETVEAAELLDIAYEICMNAELESSETAEGTIYSVILDEDGMKEVAYAIVPEAEKLDIGFTGGGIQAIVRDGKLQNLSVSCSGKLAVLLSEADVKIGAQLQFTGEEAAVMVPEAVKTSLEQADGKSGEE